MVYTTLWLNENLFRNGLKAPLKPKTIAIYVNEKYYYYYYIKRKNCELYILTKNVY